MSDSRDLYLADPGLRAPLQRRSQATLERILVATEDLLGEQLFEQLTLKAILQRAGVSVGAFYARFDGKQALLPQLQSRYGARVRAISERVLAPERWEGRDLALRCRVLVRYVVRVYRLNRGLLRALFLHWRLHPEAISDQARVEREQYFSRIAGVLLVRREEIAAPEPERAVRLGIQTTMATCRDLFLSGSVRHPLQAEDRWLAEELARGLHAYLTAPSTK